MKIAVNEQERLQAIEILQQQQLPTSDIDEDKLLYLLMNGEKVIGTAGLEIFEDCALLRSVSVLKEEQGKGYGKVINKEIENYARESGINCYLLITTAKDFLTGRAIMLSKEKKVRQLYSIQPSLPLYALHQP